MARKWLPSEDGESFIPSFQPKTDFGEFPIGKGQEGDRVNGRFIGALFHL